MSLPVVCCLSCALVCALGTVECWGGRQGGCGPELCVRRLRVCGSPLAGCVSCEPFVSVCRSCVSSSSVQRPPIPRWCPVRAWLFFTFLPTYLLCVCVCVRSSRSSRRRYARSSAGGASPTGAGPRRSQCRGDASGCLRRAACCSRRWRKTRLATRQGLMLWRDVRRMRPGGEGACVTTLLETVSIHI